MQRSIRVLAGSEGVHPATGQRVTLAAQQIGFKSFEIIGSRTPSTGAKHSLGFLLPPTTAHYGQLAKVLHVTAERLNGSAVDIQVEFLRDFSAQEITARLSFLAETCNAIGLISMVHPAVLHAVEVIVVDRIEDFNPVKEHCHNFT